MTTKRVMALLCGSALLSGCQPGTRVERIEIHSCQTTESRRRLAKFIIDCSAAANPKSDEEGEDLVAQCEQTGRRTICPVASLCRTTFYRASMHREIGEPKECDK